MAERRPKRSPTRERCPLLNTNINCQRPKNSITKSKQLIINKRQQLYSLIFCTMTKNCTAFLIHLVSLSIYWMKLTSIHKFNEETQISQKCDTGQKGIIHARDIKKMKFISLHLTSYASNQYQSSVCKSLRLWMDCSSHECELQSPILSRCETWNIHSYKNIIFFKNMNCHQ